MKYTIVIFLALLGFQLMGQEYSESAPKDTLWYLNGDKELVSGCRFSTDSTLIGYYNKKGKPKDIEVFYVFSINKADGTEQIIYKPQVDEGGVGISVEDMRAFVKGGYLGKKNYGGNFALVEGMLVGAASPWLIASVGLNPLYSVVLPAANSFLVGVTKPSKGRIMKKYPKESQSKYFVDGFREAAKRKRTKKSILGGVIGLAAGIASVFIFK